MKAGIKLVHGIGINDSDYITQIKETVGYTQKGNKIQKLVWICPFYGTWKHMLGRCYGEKYLIERPSYSGCHAVPEWHYFMTFRKWMAEQDWQGKHLDKDILSPGNKIYGPETCVFVDQKVNSFVLERSAARGEWPIGVSFLKSRGKFEACCKDIATGKKKFLGYYNDPQQAHQAWLAFKLEQAYILAAEQTDPRVAKALIERYKNYGKLERLT